MSKTMLEDLIAIPPDMLRQLFKKRVPLTGGEKKALKFNTAVHQMQSTKPDSVKKLQSIVGTKVDGIWGPKSDKKLKAYIDKNQSSSPTEVLYIPDFKSDDFYIGKNSIYDKYINKQYTTSKDIAGNLVRHYDMNNDGSIDGVDFRFQFGGANEDADWEAKYINISESKESKFDEANSPEFIKMLEQNFKEGYANPNVQTFLSSLIKKLSSK